jgi:5-methylcytosine-specific restriction endonuclease McrA
MATKGKNARLKRRLWAVVHGCVLTVAVPCHWCGCRITFDQATVDHVRPRSEGGADDLSNVVIACDDCNQLRNKLTQAGVW